MKKLLQNIVAIWQRKRARRSPKKMRRKGLNYGFTLIELLVAALIASLLVSVLLGFLLAVLDSDRKETAKSNAQEELQAAISYIADDLQEAIYIYGADALAGINSQLPHTQTTGTSSECNTTNCTPILVFWKRNSYSPNSTGTYSKIGADPSSRLLGCMPYKEPTNCDQQSGTEASKEANPYQTAFGRDTYTTALVAYYLKNDSANTSSTWSNTARILRWEIKDGYVWYCSTGGSLTDTTDCPTTKATPRLPNATSPKITVSGLALADTSNYFIVPSKGFNRLDFTGSGSPSAIAATWKKFDDFDLNTDKFITLVDFMDDTNYQPTQGGNLVATGTGTFVGSASGINIPIGRNDPTPPPSTNLDCNDPSIGVGNVDPTNIVTQRIPNQFDNSDGSNPSRLSSFYACVSPDGVSGSTARIFLRGNAIARLATPAINRDLRRPNANNITFFPTADVRSFGRSAIGIKKK